MSSDDPDLLAKIATGDQIAFEEFLGRHGSFIFGRARRSLGKLRCIDATDHAQDVSQEVGERLWQRAGQYDANKKPVRAWLTRIIDNLCIDHRRRRCFPGEASIDDPDTSGFLGDGRVPDVGVQAMNWQVLRKLYSQLTRDEQRLMVLIIDDLSHDEIGQRLGITEGAVKVRKYRLVQRLIKLADSKGLGEAE